MGTDCEEAVKRILFEEWVGLPYQKAGQTPRDRIDGEFLEMEVAGIKKARRKVILFFAFYGIFMLLQVIKVSPGLGWKQTWDALFPTVMATFIAFSGATQYLYFQKRRMIYRLLKPFEGTAFP